MRQSAKYGLVCDLVEQRMIRSQFGSVRLAYQDIAAGVVIHERALAAKLGTQLQFL